MKNNFIVILFIIVLFLLCLLTVYAVPTDRKVAMDLSGDYKMAVYGLIATLLTVLGVLISVIAMQFKNAVDENKDVAILLFAKYEDHERRLSVQETVCENCRRSCPDSRVKVKY